MPRGKRKEVDARAAQKSKVTPYTINSYFKKPAEESLSYPMFVIKVKECPNFVIYFCTWDRNASHFTHMLVANYELVGYKGGRIRERISGTVDFTKDFMFSSDEVGPDVPDDVRFFLRDAIVDFIAPIKEAGNDYGWGMSKDRLGFPLVSMNKLMDSINGVCMARPKGSKVMRKIVEEVETEVEDEDTLSLEG